VSICVYENISNFLYAWIHHQYSQQDVETICIKWKLNSPPAFSTVENGYITI